MWRDNRSFGTASYTSQNDCMVFPPRLAIKRLLLLKIEILLWLHPASYAFMSISKYQSDDTVFTFCESIQEVFKHIVLVVVELCWLRALGCLELAQWLKAR